MPLFDTGIADLGKRRRLAAFRADSACKTAQKLLAGPCAQDKDKAGLAFASGKLLPGPCAVCRVM